MMGPREKEFKGDSQISFLFTWVMVLPGNAEQSNIANETLYLQIRASAQHSTKISYPPNWKHVVNYTVF